MSFKKLLLNRCQEEFLKDKKDATQFEVLRKKVEEAATEVSTAPSRARNMSNVIVTSSSRFVRSFQEEKKELAESLEFEVMKAKRRSLGNIRFIGELFKLSMLTEKIMHDECIMQLLRATDSESLECLCRLLSTIGKRLDNEKSKVQPYFIWLLYSFSLYFTVLVRQS